MSTRELILADMKTVLAAIATGGGYNNTVKLCSRRLQHFNELAEDQFPALFVAGANQDIVNSTNTHFTAKLKATIIGYVRTADAAAPEQVETDLSALIEDVIKALYVDHTRNGNARYTQMKGDVTSRGAWIPFAGFEMEVECEYRASFAAP